jgi:hypothetical protein
MLIKTGLNGNYSFTKTATQDTELPGFSVPLQAGTKVTASYVSARFYLAAEDCRTNPFPPA